MSFDLQSDSMCVYDAALITAAPDLLAALSDLLAVMTPMELADAPKTVRRARAAIDKATGVAS